ncbi:PfkB family carbohydrate kinase [Arcobacter sp.]|uniref:PfkB family carbohydrate kinase n=1 Tax=Arcobacter sp. TaxID=1872629 RepID=UPI003D0FA63A
MSKKFNDIYIYGEILFDCFENGDDKLGGASFNVAWNLKGFGLNPKMVSSISNDELGKKVLNRMINWNMDISYINIIPDKKTGKVNVKLNDEGIPTYTFEEDCAYDYIDVPKDITENSLVYHGSFALRNKYNQKNCILFKNKLNSNSFVDVNLREPWWDNSLLQTILTDLKWLKMNDEELPFICSLLGLNSIDEDEQIEFVLEKLNLELLVLTKGAEGAVLLDKNKSKVSSSVVKIDKIADTVGAGDAFVSVVILGLYNSWDNVTILKRAVSFASKVCGLNGAIIEDKNFYNNFLKEWNI